MSDITTWSPSTSSPAGFPVRIFPWLGSVPGSTAIVPGSGGTSFALLWTYDPDTSSWRTSQVSLFAVSPTSSSDRWPRRGLMRNGSVYALPTWARPTSASGSSSLPTPTARDHKDGSASSCANVPVNGLLGRWVHTFPTPTATPHGRNRSPSGGAKERLSLRSMASRGMWPTSGPDYARAGQKGSGGDDLATAIARSSWATPSVNGDYNRKGASAKSDDGLATQAGGSLNPTWVEGLMGFPVDWTEVG